MAFRQQQPVAPRVLDQPAAGLQRPLLQGVVTYALLSIERAAGPTVWWDDISFERIPAPAPRPVTIATINLRPQGTKSAQESVGQFIAALGKTVPPKTDVILLPEGITVIGTGKKYVDVAETVPGPTTDQLGRVAKERSSYI